MCFGEAERLPARTLSSLITIHAPNENILAYKTPGCCLIPAILVLDSDQQHIKIAVVGSEWVAKKKVGITRGRDAEELCSIAGFTEVFTLLLCARLILSK